MTKVKAATSNDERMRQVEQALAIGNLEGAVSDPQTMGNLMELALGQRTADEVKRCARRRYGPASGIKNI